MNLGPYQIQITVIPAIFVAAGVFLLVNLGTWQIERADEKEAIIAETVDRRTAAPLSLVALDKLADKNYYHLKVQGQLDNKHYLLLDNRIYKGRAGFEVIQPMMVDAASKRVVLVNRGWIPYPLARSDLPAIPEITGLVEIIGEVSLPTKTIVLRADDLTSVESWPVLVQSIELEPLSVMYKKLGLNIEPWILRQEEDDNPFYRRLWIYVNLSPDRHMAYAVTWFGLALALIIIYIAAITSRKERKIATD